MNDDSRVLKLRSNVAVSWSLYLEVAVAEVGGRGRGWRTTISQLVVVTWPVTSITVNLASLTPASSCISSKDSIRDYRVPRPLIHCL